MISMESNVVEVSVNDDDTAVLQGIIANDAEDGDLTHKLIVEGMSRFISKGKRSVKIGVVDSADNVTEVTRDVIYTDYVSPKFSLKAPLIFPVGTSKIDGVITATDMIDGNITGKIRMKSDFTDLGDREGSFPVTFTCSNSLGDSSEIPLTITYDSKAADSSYPKITLTDYLIYVKQDTSIYLWDYVASLTANRKTYQQVWDEYRYVLVPNDDSEAVTEGDFEISSGGLNTGIPGIYEVTFAYTDAQGRSGRTCLVVVVEGAE